jgi:diguanylate cyclase (GGDEF)-like protein/PAS domain S-box-containing protein
MLVAATWVAHFVLLLVLVRRFPSITATALIPILLTAALYGTTAGLIASTLGVVLNEASIALLGVVSATLANPPISLWPLALTVVVSVALGRLGDVTRQLAATTTRLGTSESHLRTIIDGTAAALLSYDSQGRIEWVNAAAERLLGYPPGALAGSSLAAIDRPGWPERLAILAAQLAGGAGLTIQTEYRRLDGQSIPVEIRSALLAPGATDASATVQILSTARDMTTQRDTEDALRSARSDLKRRVVERTKELEDANVRLTQLVREDTLTGLSNRAHFHESLNKAIARAHRTGQTVAIFYIDLGRFKAINDTHGHEAGDAALREVATRLRASTRAGDLIARLGGDEFGIIIEAPPRISDIAVVAQKVVSVVGSAFRIGQADAFLSASVGIALFPEDGADYAPLIRNADAAMYVAKRHRPGTYQFYAEHMTEEADRQIQLESSLRQALDRDEFHLVYQPKARFSDGLVIGAEALIRWQHPELGSVPPAEFIPIAERSGLIMSIGEWVLRRACADAAAWQRQGSGDVAVAVNVSVAQFRTQAFPEALAAHLQAAGLSATQLQIEVTESLLMTDIDASTTALEALRGTGVSVAIDDFGTGYSSLSYLRRFPLSALKIDRSFVTDIETGSDGEAIASTIVDLAHSLRLITIAEGVETQAQHDWLAKRGCEIGQGLLYSAPLPFDDFVAFLQQDAGELQLLESAPSEQEPDLEPDLDPEDGRHLAKT